MSTKKILIIGLTSSGIGGMEFHNLGNYIIMEVLIDELKKTFSDAKIRTSIQMSEKYCNRYNIVSLRDRRFHTYGLRTGVITFVDILKIGFWKSFSLVGIKLGFFINSSKLLSELKEADLIIDFSGDIYGDNSSWTAFLESNAELIFARILKKKTAMIIGSPGPFRSAWRQALAKNVLMHIDLLTNREAKSTELMEYNGIKGEHIHSTACPSVLFSKESETNMKTIYQAEGLNKKRSKPLLGFIICGWNMPSAPYNKWPRKDWEYQNFVKVIDYLIKEKNVDVCVMSHQNGTDKKGNLIKQNDHRIINRLMQLVGDKYTKEEFFTLKGLYTAAQSKSIISKFDVLVSGRIHGAVQGLSQYIPTAIINYGHEPIAHKIIGFADVYGVAENIMNPLNFTQMQEVVTNLIDNREGFKKKLQDRVPEVKKRSLWNFQLLNDLAKK